MNSQSHTTWQEARDVLDNARQWHHHNPDDWAVLDGHLDELETAASCSDAEAAIRVVAKLELMSPHCRSCTPDKADAIGIPVDTLDFLNHVDVLITENLDDQK